MFFKKMKKNFKTINEKVTNHFETRGLSNNIDQGPGTMDNMCEVF